MMINSIRPPKTDSAPSWKGFFLEDVVIIANGKRLTKAAMRNGDIPFIGASEMLNGITGYTSSINESLDKNVLGVNYNGSVCYSFYHPYKAIFSDDVKRVKWKDAQRNNKYTLLFLATSIMQQKIKYAYGYKFNTQRMRRQKIMLPACANGTPDWQFMEDFMKVKEQKILKHTIEKLCKQLIDNEVIEGQLLQARWKAFDFTEVFTVIQRGKRLKRADHKEGDVPYVSSTSLNNGVDSFVGNEGRIRRFSDCLTLANSGSVGCTFYHHYEFVASDYVTQLKRNGLDKYAYLFLSPIVQRLSEKYSFNREINDERIKKEKLLLPATENGEVDYEFMSSFMKEVETDILKATLKTFKQKLLQSEYKGGYIADSQPVEFKDFVFGELFSIKATSSGIDRTKLNGCVGHIPYLTRSNIDNAITDFIREQDIDLGAKDEGNVITIGLDTQTVFYQPKAFYTGQNIQIIRHERLNRYNAIYIIVVIKQLVGKFSWGSYGATLTRLRRGKLYLPVDSNGEPDWAYMERKAREAETRLLLTYLNSKKIS